MLMQLITGGPKYTKILVTALVIFANPHSLGPWVDSSPDASVRTAAKAYTAALTILTQKQEMAVEHGVPAARVITLHDENHYVFLSNQTDVLRCMSAFLAELQPQKRLKRSNTSYAAATHS
jgi:non-heme chloroperoxidase